jgi:phosphoglycolate phosphatase-like HAD superfamily hydrolase
LGGGAAFGGRVAADDAPLKPDPAPVRAALRALGVERAWMLGDTPDDARAARAAGVLPVGVIPPGEPADSATRDALERAGAGRVLRSPLDIESCLP